MKLLLHPHTNVSDPVWSVIFMVFLSLCMAGYSIYYILGVDEKKVEKTIRYR